MNRDIYTVGGLYAGIGGIEKGFLNAGFKVLWANENDSKSCITYRTNFHHMLYEEDVYKLNPNKLEKVDILAAGFPCQAFSVAGYRKGFEDPRGNHFFRIMEIAEILQPKVLFLENVKNFKSHDKGKTWETVKEYLSRHGYLFKAKVLNTKAYGNVPQTRERFYAVCFNQKYKQAEKAYYAFSFPKSIALSKGIVDIISKYKVDSKYYYGKERYMYDELKKNMTRSDTVYQWRRKYVRENKSNVCPTLTANMGTGGHNVPLIKTRYGFRKLTPQECFRFQGFGDIKLPDIADAHLYKQAGNSVSVPVIERIAVNINKALHLAKNLETREYKTSMAASA